MPLFGRLHAENDAVEVRRLRELIIGEKKL